MTLSAMEFLRRFVQHILPRGFVRIRQSGFRANTCRAARVALARTLLAPPGHDGQLHGRDADHGNSDRTDMSVPTVWSRHDHRPILSALHLAAVTLGFDTS
jgi:hypothetical protein